MKRFHLTIFILIAVVTACTKDDKPTYSVPSRVAENDVNACPAFSGEYQNVERLTGKIIFDKRSDGVLVLRGRHGSSDLPVTGEPTRDQKDGSMATAICQKGQVEIEYSGPDGHIRAVFKKGSNGDLESYGEDDAGNRKSTSFRQL